MEKEPAVVVVGGAGLVGRYLLRRWKAKLEAAGSREKLLSLDLRKSTVADESLVADLRDPAIIETILFQKYDVRTMIVAVKPPLVGASYQGFMEVNLAGLCDLVNLAELHKVGSLVYVSSFAACNHWLPHKNTAESEKDASPPLTSLRSPYDLSKAMTEQFILQKHSKTGMRTVSVRIGGVYGDDDDQYWNRRLPFRLSLDISHQRADYPMIDANYVENIAEGLLRVAERLSEDVSIGGRFYFYTIGDRRVSANELGVMMAELNGRFHLAVPTWVIREWLWVMTFISSFCLQLPSMPLGQPAGRALEPKAYYTRYSMSKMGLVSQTFENSLFRQTFGYSHVYTTEEACERVCGQQKRDYRKKPEQSCSHKRPGTMALVAGPVLISLCTVALVILCGGLSLSSVACSASSGLCSLCQVGFFASTPATHVCAAVTQPAYRLWMPFHGGRLHVLFQGVGWSLFALMCFHWIADWMNLDIPALLELFNDDRRKAAFALIAQVLLGLSVLVFKERSNQSWDRANQWERVKSA